ncbi:MAG: DUF362 domain-containing protein [Candidatus Riflebacteria bacterium]|nr:DUF362 domain-containing protein [Candidatus Riflebacteria bacterium]
MNQKKLSVNEMMLLAARFLGFFAFLWLLLRSFSNPKRIGYPCQRAALSLSKAWIAEIVAFFTASVFLKKILDRSKYTLIASIAVFAAFFFIWTSVFLNPSVEAMDFPDPENPKTIDLLPVWQVEKPVSKIFAVERIPDTSSTLASGDASVSDSHLNDSAIDVLIENMRENGTEFYNTEKKQGIINKNDVVVIKVNYQWEHRSGTNTDRLKGVINSILSHPEGFSGEIMVVDNTQDANQLPIDELDNNSDDLKQSVIDVINTFQAKGYNVSIRNLAPLNQFNVEEYSAGNLSEGYVYSESEEKVSWPKFKTPLGKHVSMRYGLWDNESKKYSRSSMKVINMPVLKAHISCGVTEGIKNWVGFFCVGGPDLDKRYRDLNYLHDEYFFGTKNLIPKMIEIIYPDLTIIDATWVNAINHNERGECLPIGLEKKFRTDYLIHARTVVASLDPCAASWYSAKYVLAPVAYFKTRVDPDLPKSEWFRLDLKAEGVGYTYAETLSKYVKYLKETSKLKVTANKDEISVFKSTMQN